MVSIKLCPLCGYQAHIIDVADSQEITCEVCGKFLLTGTAAATLESIDTHGRRKIGFWTRDQNELGESPVVDTHKAKLALSLPDSLVMERAERLLRHGIKAQRVLGGVFNLSAPGLQGYTHSYSINDVRALAELLCENGWLFETFRTGHPAQVTPKGFMHAAEANVSTSSNGFIAMWFDKTMDEARDLGLAPAIRNAGYTSIVVSGVEHINKIDDEIISQIRRSKFLVADFTGHRGGVYFEAGFAMGLGLPVFWTCRQDDLAKLHFDIRQYNCIDWTDTLNLQTRLTRRIEAVLGRGPLVASNG